MTKPGSYIFSFYNPYFVNKVQDTYRLLLWLSCKPKPPLTSPDVDVFDSFFIFLIAHVRSDYISLLVEVFITIKVYGKKNDKSKKKLPL